CGGTEESVTVTVNDAVAVTVGVPPKAPVVEFNVMPVGKAPAETEKVNGFVPPLTAIVPVYGVPFWASGSVVEVMDSDCELTNASAIVAVCGGKAESFT